MKLKFTDIPKYVPVEEYHAAMDRMVASLSNHKEILSIYQIGGLNTPGISDIDFYIVFDDNCNFNINPVKGISDSDRYLFSHNLFGTSKSYATQLEQYTFFGNYKHLHGIETNFFDYTISHDDTILLQQQIALEYLIKAWLSIRIQLFYGIIKTRGLLLHSKAILFDLKFLNINDGPLMNTINSLMDIRNNWFNKNPDYELLEQLCYNYSTQLEQTIISESKRCGFFMDAGQTYKISKRIKLSESTHPEFRSKGLSLPHFLTSSFPLILKIQVKLSYFEIQIPVSLKAMPSIIKKRRETIKSAIHYNNKHLPDFICGGFPLQIFAVKNDH